MAKTVGIGIQNFSKIIENNCFYVDKTAFLKEWWENYDEVTLITRPRRFGKTLTMSMTEQFFSVKYAGRGDLFEGLAIWQEEKYRSLQGTYPVLSLSFANVKETNYQNARRKICQFIADLYADYSFLLESDVMREGEREFYRRVSSDMGDVEATLALHNLSKYLNLYYGKKVIILLDEYDTPMQEAYAGGYWEEIVGFTRNLFNATFKTNPYLERALMTGITRVSKESIFSDLNNLKVVSATSEKYETMFGFTEEEVFAVLEEYGLSDRKQQIKDWYDGFTFGKKTDIYNPWSVINFIDEKKPGAYWTNTSANSLVGKLIREGSPEIKITMEKLLRGETFHTTLDEQIVFSQLDQEDSAVWSLLLASGYLKAVHYEFNTMSGKAEYALQLTNREVKVMFERMIESWFGSCRRVNNAFLKALLEGDLKAMNDYLNKITQTMFSYFDTGKKPSKEEPERFYHGFVLGMMVELADRYVITSNRESGFGRYDIMMEPRTVLGTQENDLGIDGGLTEDNDAVCAIQQDAIIIEFKVQDTGEKELSDTVKEALRQIEERNYETNLVARGIPKKRIRKYGFAFCGKEVLIG